MACSLKTAQSVVSDLTLHKLKKEELQLIEARVVTGYMTHDHTEQVGVQCLPIL